MGGYVEEVGGAPCGVQGAGCSQDLGCPLDAHGENRDRFGEHRLALEVLEMVLVDDQTVSMMTLKKKREEVSSFWKKDKRWTNSAEVLCGVGVVHGPSAEVLRRVVVCGAQGQCRGAVQGGCVWCPGPVQRCCAGRVCVWCTGPVWKCCAEPKQSESGT